MEVQVLGGRRREGGEIGVRVLVVDVVLLGELGKGVLEDVGSRRSRSEVWKVLCGRCVRVGAGGDGEDGREGCGDGGPAVGRLGGGSWSCWTRSFAEISKVPEILIIICRGRCGRRRRRGCRSGGRDGRCGIKVSEIWNERSKKFEIRDCPVRMRQACNIAPRIFSPPNPSSSSSSSLTGSGTGAGAGAGDGEGAAPKSPKSSSSSSSSTCGEVAVGGASPTGAGTGAGADEGEGAAPKSPKSSSSPPTIVEVSSAEGAGGGEEAVPKSPNSSSSESTSPEEIVFT